MNKDNLLDSIQNQIIKFDAKATSLIGVVGVIFGLSLELFSSIKILVGTVKIVGMIFVGIYLISFVLVIFSLIFIIYPRSARKNSSNILYYKDIADMKENEYIVSLKNEFDKEGNHNIDKQIHTNAIICKRKHYWLNMAIFGLIPMFISLISIIIIGYLL